MAATLRAVASAGGSGGSISCNRPTGTVEGDLLLGFHTVSFTELADMTTPTGGTTWEPLGSQLWADGDPGTKVWWKIAGSSESASYGFPQTSGGEGVVAVAAVITPVTIAPLFASSASTTSTASIPTPSGMPTAAEGLELRWAAATWAESGNATWTPPATYTEQVDRQQGEASFFTAATAAPLASKTLSSNAATGVQNFTASITMSNHMGVTVVIAGVMFSPPAPMLIGQAINRAANY